MNVGSEAVKTGRSEGDDWPDDEEMRTAIEKGARQTTETGIGSKATEETSLNRTEFFNLAGLPPILREKVIAKVSSPFFCQRNHSR